MKKQLVFLIRCQIQIIMILDMNVKELLFFSFFIHSLNGSYFRLILAKWKGYRFYLKYLISMALKTEDISSFVS